MKIIFFGTPNLSVPFLKALVKEPTFEIMAVITQPDKKAGRGKKLSSSEIKIEAIKLKIPILQFTNLKDDLVVEKLRSLKANLYVVVAYGKLIPSSVLALPTRGVVNVHPSILPTYRGPSPMQFAILNGDKTTGISIMLLDEGMDTGPILAQKTIELSDDETTSTLEKKIGEIGPKFLIETLNCFDGDTCISVPQENNKASYTRLLVRDDGRIKWQKSAQEIERMIRAFQPWPGAWTTMKTKNGNTRVKILSAKISSKNFNKTYGTLHEEDSRFFVSCGTESVEIITLQLEGKQPMTAQAFLAGRKDWIGRKFE